MRMSMLAGPGLAFVIASAAALPAPPQPTTATDPAAAMHWRHIGPTRAGRARAVAGVPSQPNVAYIGFDNGGVWRSTDYGANWVPLFDRESTGSIGAIAVAPSDPNIIYVGTGAGIIRPDLATGNGIYKSTDAGQDVDASRAVRQSDDREHRRLAARSESPLRRGRSAIPYGPNAERGIFRSTDGGKTLREGALQGRVHERQRRPHRSERPEHRLRRAVAAAAELHRRRRLRRPRRRTRRHLQVHRRRHDVEAADRRAAARAAGEPRDRAEQSEDALRDGRLAALRAATPADAAARWARGRRQRRRSSTRRPTAATTGPRGRSGGGSRQRRSASARPHRRRRPARP